MKIIIICLIFVALVANAKKKIAFRMQKIGFPETNYNQTVIHNAEEAKLHEAPFIVSLTRTEFGPHYCAGAILSSTLIITAAHCAIYLNIFVHAGYHDRYKKGTGQIVQVGRKIVHKEYTGNFSEHDIALLVLSAPLFLDGQKLAAIKLPVQKEQMSNTNCTLFGWGKSTSTATNNLMATRTVLLTAQECKVLLPAKSPSINTNVCTSGRKGISVCNGDSGAPLVIYENNHPILVGIATWVYSPCSDKSFPSVYTCTISHAKWIGEQREYFH